MNKNEFRKYIVNRDAETCEDRVTRWSEINPVIYNHAKLPELLSEYSAEAIQLYIYGHFPSVIIWCASIIELSLEDKLIANGKGTKEVIMLLGLLEKTRLCRKFGIITSGESKGIDKIRLKRNTIAHANAGKLSEMKKVNNEDSAETLFNTYPGLYLSNLGGIIEIQSREFLSFTRKLIERLYE